MNMGRNYLSSGKLCELLQMTPANLMRTCKAIGIEPAMRLDEVAYYGPKQLKALGLVAQIETPPVCQLDDAEPATVAIQAAILKAVRRDGAFYLTSKTIEPRMALEIAELCARGALELIADESGEKLKLSLPKQKAVKK